MPIDPGEKLLSKRYTRDGNRGNRKVASPCRSVFLKVLTISEIALLKNVLQTYRPSLKILIASLLQEIFFRGWFLSEACGAEKMLYIIRSHWAIGSSVHWILAYRLSDLFCLKFQQIVPVIIFSRNDKRMRLIKSNGR
jgi:hypothetical protein